MPCGAINQLDEVCRPAGAGTRHGRPLGAPAEGDLRLVASPLKLGKTPVRTERRPPPLLGQHTDEVLPSCWAGTRRIAASGAGGGHPRWRSIAPRRKPSWRASQHAPATAHFVMGCPTALFFKFNRKETPAWPTTCSFTAPGAAPGTGARCSSADPRRPPRPRRHAHRLGERACCRPPSPWAHIADVRQALAAEELPTASWSCIPTPACWAPAVADREPPGTLRHLVYVDAVVPKPGESWAATHASATRRERLHAAEVSPTSAFRRPTRACSAWRRNDHEWVRRQTPHPATPTSEPLDFDRAAAWCRAFIDCTAPKLPTIDAIRQRVRDPGFWGGAWLPGSRVVRWRPGTIR